MIRQVAKYVVVNVIDGANFFDHIQLEAWIMQPLPLSE